MAMLVAKAERRARPVPARLVVGRAATCGLRLSEAVVSNEHAVVTWTGSRWTLRDLGSRNGTYLDGTRLRSGTLVGVSRGAVLAFGDRELAWELTDDQPPVAMAMDLVSGEVRAAPDGLLALPHEDAVELAIYENAAGEWVSEPADGEPQPLVDEAIVEAGGRAWLVQVPSLLEGTPQMAAPLTLGAVTLEFAVPKNEERVEITVLAGPREIRLETREHLYILLTLARARLEDADRPPSERGWRRRDELERMLAMDENALNVAIHRARQQLRAAEIVDAAGIVEVRRGARRLGTERVRILPLDRR